MVYDNPEKGEYFIWRFMIDERYQKLGFGRRAMELVLEYVKSRPMPRKSAWAMSGRRVGLRASTTRWGSGYRRDVGRRVRDGYVL
jgi:GNAT superfamily N-acetyltransferase